MAGPCSWACRLRWSNAVLGSHHITDNVVSSIYVDILVDLTNPSDGTYKALEVILNYDDSIFSLADQWFYSVGGIHSRGSAPVQPNVTDNENLVKGGWIFCWIL